MGHGTSVAVVSHELLPALVAALMAARIGFTVEYPTQENAWPILTYDGKADQMTDFIASSVGEFNPRAYSPDL